MTLHDAIVFVIGNKMTPLKIRDIADEINSLGIYKREDREPLESNQISARVNNNPDIFGITDDGLVYVKQANRIQYQKLVSQLKSLLRDVSLENADIITATYIFIARTKEVFPGYLGQINIGSFNNKNLQPKSKEYVKKYQTGFSITDDDKDFIAELFRFISADLELNIYSLLSRYDFSLDACSHSQFGIFFNDLLNSATLKGGALGDFATPSLVSRIIASLAKLKDGEVVFDPFGGNAGLFCDIKKFQNFSYKLRLNDIDKNCVWLGKMNLVVNNISDFEYFCDDSVNSFLYNESHLIKYDWIITHPPFGTKLPKNFTSSLNQALFGPSNKSEIIFLELVLSQLKKGGKAIIIVPEAFLYTEDKAYLNARKFLVNNGWLRSVISLPSVTFLPYSSIKTSILEIEVTDSNIGTSGVKFISISESDLEKFQGNGNFDESVLDKKNSNSVIVSKSRIKKEKYTLSVNRYLSLFEYIVPKQFKFLKKLINGRFSGVRYGQKALNRIGGIPYVNIKDLAEENESFYLNPEKMDLFIDPKLFLEIPNLRKVQKGAILLAKIGNKLKPTLYESDIPIAVSHNILIIEPNTEVITPSYLAGQLREKYVKQQVEKIRGGAGQPFVRINDLLNIVLNVPPLDIQKKEESQISLELFGVNNSLISKADPTSEDIDLPSAIEHEYKNLKNPLSSNISNIRDFLEEKIKARDVLNWEDKISASRNARTLNSVFNDVTEIMSEMSSLIEDIVTVVNLNKYRSSVNMKSVSGLLYVKKVKRKIQAEFPEAQLMVKYLDRNEFNRILIQVDDNLFSKVIRNFVSNSINHGYGDATEKPVYIIVSVSDDKLYLQIDLVNDGKPFEEGFTFNDFVSFGKKAGVYKGSGIGGFIMNKIVLHHNGTLEMITVDENDNLGKRLETILKTGVHFRIRLPIIK